MAIDNQTGASGQVTLTAGGTDDCKVNWAISNKPSSGSMRFAPSYSDTVTDNPTPTLQWDNIPTGTYTITVTATKPACYVADGITNCCAGNPIPAKCKAEETFTLTVMTRAIAASAYQHYLLPLKEAQRSIRSR